MNFLRVHLIVVISILLISKSLSAEVFSLRGYLYKSEKLQNTFLYSVFSNNEYTQIKPLTTSIESVFKLLSNGDFVDLSGEKTAGQIVVIDQVNEVRVSQLYGRWKNRKTDEIYLFYQSSNIGSILSQGDQLQFQYTLTPSSNGQSINMIFTIVGKDVKIFDFSLTANKLCLKLYDDLGRIVEKHEFKKISK